MEHTGRIRELGPKADGIMAGPKGPIYVECTAPGDLVQVNARRDSGGLWRGDLVRVVEASPQRVSPPCPHYETCGGCTVQHISPEAYKSWKEGMVRRALEKQGVKVGAWQTPVYVPAATRRRATLAVTKVRGRLKIGYFGRRSKDIASIETCLVAHPSLWSLRGALPDLLGPLVPEGGAVDVFLQRATRGLDMVVTGPLAFGRDGMQAATAKAAAWAEAHGVSRIGYRKAVGKAVDPWVNLGPVTASFGVLDVRLPPAAFMQPTEEGQAALVASVMEKLPARGPFADLFSGCGTFTGPMLARGPVEAYESEGPAIEALAKAGGGRALKAVRRDLFATPLRREEANRYEAIVMDPPRAGAEAQTRALASSKVKTIVMVSCNPATFARDAALLLAGGYRCQSVQMVDQFVWSHHVELVAQFTKKRA